MADWANYNSRMMRNYFVRLLRIVIRVQRYLYARPKHKFLRAFDTALVPLWVPAVVFGISVGRLTNFNFFVFNVDSFAHHITEALGLEELCLSEPGPRRVVFFRLKFRNKTNNAFILRCFSELFRAKNLIFLGVPESLWLCLIAIAKVDKDYDDQSVLSTFPSFRRLEGRDLRPDLLRLIPAKYLLDFEEMMDSQLPGWRSGFSLLGIRDGEFYGDDDSIRNSPEGMYEGVAEFLIDYGIPIVRIGRRNTRRIGIVSPSFFNYAMSSRRCDEFDVILWCKSLFSFGDDSGLTGANAFLGGHALYLHEPFWPTFWPKVRGLYYATQQLWIIEHNRPISLAELKSLMASKVDFESIEELRSLGFESKPLAPELRIGAMGWFLSEQLQLMSPSTDHLGIEEPSPTQWNKIEELSEDGLNFIRTHSLEHLWIDNRMFPGSREIFNKS